MENDTKFGRPKRCGILFNIGITLMVLYFYFSCWLFHDSEEKNVIENISTLPWIKENIKLEIAVGSFHILVIFILGTTIIKCIWNRLFVRLFHFNVLSTGEAYCILLTLLFVSELLFGGI